MNIKRIATTCGGMVLGGMVLSVVTTCYHALAFNAVLRDGQYAMIWMFTLPAGSLIGWCLAESVHSATAKLKRGILCLLGGAVLFLVVAGYVGLTAANGYQVSREPIAANLIEGSLFALPTLCCAIGLCWRGLALRVGARAAD